MSEEELGDLIVVKHSRHDRAAGQHHAGSSDDQHDASAQVCLTAMLYDLQIFADAPVSSHSSCRVD